MNRVPETAPAWRLPEAIARLAHEAGPAETAEERMALVIQLASTNVDGGGGPFGAAVFGRSSGRLVSVGVNLVLASKCSNAHAEMVALAMAQASLGCHDLAASGLEEHELVSSSEPCVMCLGATVWSGVTRIVTGSRDEDVRAIGFDEGPKPQDWTEALERRGIEVARDVLRNDAVAVLQRYSATGGVVYNPARVSPLPRGRLPAGSRE